ncbi:phosphatase PAP2 family protein [Ancylobacter dichloromethanicus]
MLADSAIYRALQDLRTAPGDAVMIAITELGDTVVVVAVTVIVFLWLAWKRAWRTAAYWLVAIAGASALNTAIKMALHRARPGDLHYSGWSAFSFPSGHSTINLVLYGFLTFLIAREFRSALRVSVALGAATLIFFLIGFFTPLPRCALAFRRARRPGIRVCMAGAARAVLSAAESRTR